MPSSGATSPTTRPAVSARRDRRCRTTELLDREDLEFHLAYTANLEATFTPLFKMVFENRRAPFAGGDERVGTLLLWHFVEEIEHRSSVLREEDVAPEFFDLRTGLAGGAMQKFVNYRVRVAIVVPSSRARFDPRRIPSSRDSLSSPS